MQSKKSKINKKVFLNLSILVAAILIFTMGLFVLNNFFNYMHDPEFDVVFHCSGTDDMSYADEFETARMHDGLRKILLNETLLTEYYEVNWHRGKVFTKHSEKYLLSDQINLLSFYARENERTGFRNLNAIIEMEFMNEEGLFVDSIYLNEHREKKTDGEISFYSQVSYCRALIEGYFRFGNSSYLELAKQISELIYPVFKRNNMMFPPGLAIEFSGPSPTPDFSATPTPRPTVTPTLSPEDIRKFYVVDLSEIDLYGLLLLGEINKGWHEVYENAVGIMEKSLVAEPFIFYRPFYNSVDGTYISYYKEAPKYDFGSQVKILYNLARVDRMNMDLYSQIRRHLYNTQTFYSHYNIIGNSPASSDESVKAYAYMAYLARIQKDNSTYDLCIERILWNTATSTTSPIYGLPFVEWDEDFVYVYSSDVVDALRALY